MRAWTKSACVVLACSILPIILVAASMKGSVHHAQANTRTANSTEVILTSTLSVVAAPVTATKRTARYVVRNGDTLSAIAARFAVRGGWPALYAANRQAIGPDPNVIHSGTVLVVPGPTAPIHYTVAAGDTLSGIAAEFAVHGGWPALYAANRQALGPDPNVVRPGTVLTIRRPAAPSPSRPRRAVRRPRPSAPPRSSPASPRHHARPVPKAAPAATGMPRWLKTVLLAVGLLILVAFLAEPVLVVRRRRQRASVQETESSETESSETVASENLPENAAPETAVQQAAIRPGTVQPLHPGQIGSAPGPGCWRPGTSRAQIVLADYDRVIVTRSKPDDTVYVLRPPGADPRAILRVARLVLPEGPYGELAKQLGLPAIGPVE
jgi:LysM repeat protein